MLRNLPVDLRKQEKLRKEEIKRSKEQNSKQKLRDVASKPALEDSFDYKKLFAAFMRRWYIIAIGLLLGGVGAHLVNTFTAPKYESTLIFHVGEEQSPFAAIDFGLDATEKNKSGFVEKLLAVLQSRSHNQAIIKKLNLDVQYLGDFGIQTIDLYGNSPFSVTISNKQSKHFSSLNYVLNEDTPTLQIVPDKNELQNLKLDQLPKGSLVTEADITIPFLWDTPFKIGNCELTIARNANVLWENDVDYAFRLLDSEKLTAELIESIKIEEAFDSEFIYKLKVEDFSALRADDYLNTSIAMLQAYEVEQKNIQAEKTLAFIQEQVLQLTDTINAIQAEMSAYRKLNAMIDLSVEGQILFESKAKAQEELASVIAQEQYFKYLTKYLHDRAEYYGLIAPSIAGIEDPLLLSLVNDLVQLSIELEEVQLSVQANNPILHKKKKELESIKRTLEENVANLNKGVQLRKASAQEQLAKANSQIADLPGKEQAFLNMHRTYEVTNEQLIYLLQKMSETEMLKAGTTPNTVVIDEALSRNNDPISPNIERNLLIGLLLGIGVPLSFLTGTTLMEDRILSETDVIQATGIPVIGRLYRCPLKTENVVAEFPESQTSESFRGIRSNARFALKSNSESNSQIILVTSSVGGEGKTFTSINLAESFAAAGMRTVLVELDLRKPKVFDAKGVKNEIGITSYLFGQYDMDEIIHPLPNSKLDLITSGPLAPNPAELFVMRRFEKFVQELRARYDFIIFDSAPLGLVSDTNELMKYADLNLYLVRFDYSRKSHLEPLVAYHQEQRAKRLYLVLNDIPRSEKGSFGYGFGYDNNVQPV